MPPPRLWRGFGSLRAEFVAARRVCVGFFGWSPRCRALSSSWVFVFPLYRASYLFGGFLPPALRAAATGALVGRGARCPRLSVPLGAPTPRVPRPALRARQSGRGRKRPHCFSATRGGLRWRSGRWRASFCGACGACWGRGRQSRRACWGMWACRLHDPQQTPTAFWCLPFTAPAFQPRRPLRRSRLPLASATAVSARLLRVVASHSGGGLSNWPARTAGRHQFDNFPLTSMAGKKSTTQVFLS